MNIVRVLFTVSAVSALAAMAGCAEPQAFQAPEPLRLHDVAYADVMQAAEKTLDQMHFVIDKLDAEQGIIRTEPLRAAQFFEFWRCDSTDLSSALEANLHTIRRSAELQIREDDGRVLVDCTVRVERLSLPENEMASMSQAYQMHSQSTASTQRLQLSPRQRAGMAWVELGQDSGLEARILEAIARKMHQPQEADKT
jgi:hypothetical protein